MSSAVRFLTSFPTLLLCFFLVACGSGAKKDEEKVQTLGPAGGTYTSDDSVISLVIPANALTSDITFSASKITNHPSGVVDNTVYDIKPDNLSFLTATDLTINYEETALPAGVNEADLLLVKLIANQWIEVATYSVDTSSNQVTGKLHSLSTYAIGIPGTDNLTGTEIGTDGGPVASDDGLANLTIPQGALDETKSITVNPITDHPSGIIADTAFNFGPDGLSFNTPVDISIEYDEQNLPQDVNETDLWLAELSEGQWFKVPGSTVDTDNNLVTGQLNGFSTYGIGYGNDLAEIDQEAYVVDTPESGSTNQFDNIADAINYLNTTLVEDETGKLVFKTDRALLISTLNLERAIVFESEDGYNATLIGPGTSPIIISSAGSLGLSGLSITNSGGMQLNTFGNLELNNNNLPATTINLGGSGNNKPLAHRKLSSRQHGVFGDFWGISNNAFVGPLRFFAGTGFKGELDLNNNSTPLIKLDGFALASTVMKAGTNITDDIFFNLTMGQQAFLKVSNHPDLKSLNMDLNLLEQTKVENVFNTIVNLQVDFDGTGYFKAFAKANNVGTAYIGIGTGTEAEYTIEDSNYEDVQTVIHKGEIDWINNGLVVKNKLELESKDQSILNLYMGAGVDIKGLLEFILKGDFKYTVAEDVRLGGFATILASGKISDIRGGGFRVETGLTIDVHGVTGSVFTSFVEGDQFSGIIDYVEPNAAQQMFSMDKADLRAGFKLSINHDLLGGGDKPQIPSSIHDSKSRALESEGIIIKNVTFTNPDFGSPGIGIGNIDEDITIESCTFSGSDTFAINIGVVNGTVKIKDNIINDAGINLTDVHGTLSITDNQIDAPQSVGGIMTTLTSEVDVSKNSITALNALNAPADSIINADNNTLNGNIIIGGGEFLPSRMRLTNNEFSSTSAIVDATARAGGLYNDPIGDSGNSGLNPELIETLIDWNEPHPCADYPPERNKFIDQEQTECHTEGISPP